MSARDCGDGVYYENAICSDDPRRFYIGNGQGCGTFWFKTKAAALKCLKNSKITSANAWDICNQCACHYSITEKGFTKYPMHACSDKKIEFVKQFEEK